MKWFFGPLIAYLMLLPYAAVMAQLFGYEWIKANPILLTEYVVALLLYYGTCILLAVGPKRHS